MDYILRPYQQDCYDSALDKLEQHRSTLIVMGTGLGKTHIFCSIARDWPSGRVLIIAHRDELIRQAASKVQAITGEPCSIEMGQEHCDEEQMFHRRDRVVVSSVQTMCRPNRQKKFNPMDFGLIIIDESHHAPAKSYLKVLGYFRQNPKVKVIGVTATPDRSDEAAMGQIFESVAYEYGIRNGIDDGWLVPIEQQMVWIDDLNFSLCRTTAGDLNLGDLSAIMESEKPLHGVMDSTMKIAGGRKTLIFSSSVAQADRVAEIANRHTPRCAEFLCGETEKELRRETVRRYARGEFQYLSNCGIATEGFDDPSIAVVSMGRPTKSRSLYCLDSKTEVLTPSGWRGIDDSIDVAAQFDMESGEASWSPVIARTSGLVPDGERMLEFSSPAMDFRVTGGHDLVIRKRHGRDRKRGPWIKIKASSFVHEPGTVEMPIAAVQSAPGVPLTDAELSFVGWFLTDGHRNKKTNAISISQGSQQPHLHKITECLVGCGLKYGTYVSDYNSQFKANGKRVVYSISYGKPRGRDKHLRGWSHLEEYIDKDFPTALERVTVEQLAVLLDAMNLGNGAKYRTIDWVQRTYTICAHRKIFADRLQSLCVRRGWKCNVRWVDNGRTGIWILHIKPMSTAHVTPTCRDGRPIPRLSDPILGERVWCIQTVAGTIITRRNGKVAILGNSQMIGRGTRPLPGVVDGIDTPEERRAAIAASEKSNLLVIDFVGNSGRHKLIHTHDVLGDRMPPQELDECLREIMSRSSRGLSTNVGSAFQACADRRAAFKKQVEEKERKKREEHQLWRMKQQEANKRKSIIGHATYSNQKVDAFSIFDVSPSREPGWHKGRKPTIKMLAALRGMGIPEPELEVMTFSGASQLLEEVGRRRKEGLCSFKQLKLLKKFGYEGEHTFVEAGRLIDAIAKNNWQRPMEVKKPVWNVPKVKDKQPDMLTIKEQRALNMAMALDSDRPRLTTSLITDSSLAPWEDEDGLG